MRQPPPCFATSWPRRTRSLVRAVVLLTTALLCACALLSRPQAVATIRLASSESVVWPASIRLGRVTATAALQSDRVVIADGALLMQYAGLRWIDAPAILVAEFLRGARAGAAESAPELSPTLDLWLTDFNLTLDQDRMNVVVGAAGELRCASGATHALAPTRVVSAFSRSDAQSIASEFSVATTELTARLLEATISARAECDRTMLEHPPSS